MLLQMFLDKRNTISRKNQDLELQEIKHRLLYKFLSRWASHTALFTMENCDVRNTKIELSV